MGRTFAQNLKEIRLAAKLTHKQLAERIGYKNPASISNLESAERGPTIPREPLLRALSKALNQPPSRFLRGVEQIWDEADDPPVRDSGRPPAKRQRHGQKHAS